MNSRKISEMCRRSSVCGLIDTPCSPVIKINLKLYFRHLRDLFAKLGFKVQVVENKSAEDMFKSLQNFARKEEHKDYPSIWDQIRDLAPLVSTKIKIHDRTMKTGFSKPSS